MSLQRLAEFDRHISNVLRITPGRTFPFRLAAFFAHSGDSWFWLAGLGLVWLFGSPAWRERAAVMILSILTLAAVVMAIKFTVRRRRPEGEWGSIYRFTDPHSFPSGHAARAAMLVILAFGLGPLGFALILLFWAPLVALARVATGLHYFSDISAGMVIGVIAGVIALAVYPLVQAIFPFLF